ncbi:hypothetical protein [Nonomuraea cavernae]|uniref:hypothetical protein n=1 Tax=Nonomuraea cavernae TaxID=2045107 RepID=UPI0033F3C56D
MECPREEAGEEDLPVLFVYEGEGTWGFLEFSCGFATPGGRGARHHPRQLA